MAAEDGRAGAARFLLAAVDLDWIPDVAVVAALFETKGDASSGASPRLRLSSSCIALIGASIGDKLSSMCWFIGAFRCATRFPFRFGDGVDVISSVTVVDLWTASTLDTGVGLGNGGRLVRDDGRDLAP